MFNSENQVGTVQHLFALQIVFLSNKKEFPKIVIKHNEERVVATTNTACFQEIKFPMKTTQTLTLKCLRKALDSSPFPALTQIEVFGRNK